MIHRNSGSPVLTRVKHLRVARAQVIDVRHELAHRDRFWADGVDHADVTHRQHRHVRRCDQAAALIEAEPAPLLSADMPDSEALAAVLAGDTSAFGVIVQRYRGRLYRVARRIVRDDDEAEDVLQQAFINAYQHLDKFAGQSKLSTWLTRIVMNEALLRCRRRRRWSEFDEFTSGESGVATDPERMAHDAELGRIIDNALEQLPPSYRTVVVLRDIEGLTTEETAECLRISFENAKVRLHRARELLRRYLRRTLKAPGSLLVEPAV